MGAPDADDEPVPKLPRGRGFKFSGPELFRIAMTLIVLVAVIIMARPCARSVSSFVMSMDGSGSGSSARPRDLPKPGTVDLPGSGAQVQPEMQYERLRPGMTDEEVKAAIERSKARATGSSTAP